MNSRPTITTTVCHTTPAMALPRALNLGVATWGACTVPKRFYGFKHAQIF